MLRYRSIFGVAALSANSGGPFVTVVDVRADELMDGSRVDLQGLAERIGCAAGEILKPSVQPTAPHPIAAPEKSCRLRRSTQLTVIRELTENARPVFGEVRECVDGTLVSKQQRELRDS